MDQGLSALRALASTQPPPRDDGTERTDPIPARSLGLKAEDLVLGWPRDKWEAFRHSQHPEQMERGMAPALRWLEGWLVGKRPDCPGFIVYGEVGRGKTGGVLALALLAARSGCSVLYTTSAALMRDHDSTEWNARDGETKAQLASRLWAPEVLVVDDVCAAAYTGPQRAFLLDLVRGRHGEGKLTIQTTNLRLDTDEGVSQYEQFLNGPTLSTYRGWRIDATKWGPSLRGRDDDNTGGNGGED